MIFWNPKLPNKLVFNSESKDWIILQIFISLARLKYIGTESPGFQLFMASINFIYRVVLLPDPAEASKSIISLSLWKKLSITWYNSSVCLISEIEGSKSDV